MGGALALLGGGTVADGGADLDDGGPVGNGLGGLDGRPEIAEAVGDIADGLDVPAVRFVPLADVLREGEVGRSIDGDEVVVVQDDELAKAEMSSEGGGLGGHPLLQAAVAADDVGVMVEDGHVGLVVGGGHVALGDGQADGVGDSLAKGTGADLDA